MPAAFPIGRFNFCRHPGAFNRYPGALTPSFRRPQPVIPAPSTRHSGALNPLPRHSQPVIPAPSTRHSGALNPSFRRKPESNLPTAAAPRPNHQQRDAGATARPAGYLWLPCQDSNQGFQLQRLTCYRYTTGQYAYADGCAAGRRPPLHHIIPYIVRSRAAIVKAAGAPVPGNSGRTDPPPMPPPLPRRPGPPRRRRWRPVLPPQPQRRPGPGRRNHRQRAQPHGDARLRPADHRIPGQPQIEQRQRPE